MSGGREERVEDFDGELSIIDDEAHRKAIRKAMAEEEQPTKSSFKLPNAVIKWFSTSRMFPTILSEWSLKRALAPSDTDTTESSDAILIDSFDMDLASTMSYGNRYGKFSSIRELFGFYLLRAFGPDGYNPETRNVTCADGTIDGATGEFTYRNITLASFLLKLFALPSRPMTLDNEGRPQYSFLQILYSFTGTSWNPVKETFSGVKRVRREEIDKDMHGNPIIDQGTGKQKMIPAAIEEQEASVSQRRWTQKKGFLVALAVIRVPLFVAFNLVTWPFRFLRNLLKLVTEVLLPVISYGMMKLSGFLFDLLPLIVKYKPERGHPLAHMLWKMLPILVVFYSSVAIGIAQYAMSLICRIGLAFTSPLTSALLAYKSGVLIRGYENTKSFFSIFVGALGFVLSMALSATVWAITWPLALGALVTAVPALLTPITALSQSPFIANVLAWLTQLPFVASLSTAFGTAFGVVGTALTATFGAAIASLGSFVGVAIPQVVVAFSLVMSVVVAPALTLVTWPVEALSNRIMQWVERRPFRPLINGLYSLFGKEVSKEEGAKVLDAKDILVSNPLYAYQPVKGGMIIVSESVLHLTTQSEMLRGKADNAIKTLEALNITDISQGKQLWNKARAGNGYRRATDAEKLGTKAKPAIVEVEERPAKRMRN